MIEDSNLHSRKIMISKWEWIGFEGVTIIQGD